MGEEASGGGAWGDWGNMLSGVVEYGLKSKIDAEINAPTRLEERKLELMGADGEMFAAGEAGAGLSRYIVPGLIGIAALVLVVMVVKD